MHLLKIRKKFERLHCLIKQHSTGSPQELADKLGIAERTARNYVEQLREMGAPLLCVPSRVVTKQKKVIFT
jgi:predicted ArsR family transcriptional regulator